MDQRSLALFRIAVGFVVFLDLIQRLGHASTFYSDDGVLPRVDAIDTLSQYRWSVFFFNGSPEFASAVLVVGIIAALAMMLGWKTRVATIVLWIIVFSVQSRNAHLSSGADTMLRVTLFWAMLLPLGSAWSLDRHFTNQLKPSSSINSMQSGVTSMAGFGLILQMACVYFFTAIMKDSPKWREDGSALYYALGAREVTTGFGNWVFHSAPDWLLQSLTYTTLILEFAAPIMLLLPLTNGWLRSVGVLLIVALHVGIVLTLEVGLFPLISIAAIVGVLPRSFWESAFVRSQVTERLSELWAKVTGVLDRTAWPRDLQHNPVPVSSSSGSVESANQQAFHFSFNPRNLQPGPGAMIGNVIAAVMIVVMLAWNIQSVSAYVAPQPMRATAISTGMYQTWSMFAPGPKTATVWYVVDGQLASGEVVDLYGPLQNGETTIREPLPVDQSNNVEIQDKYWRKYLGSIRGEEMEKQRFAAFICRTWNADHSEENRLDRVTFHRGIAITLPNSERAEPDYDQLGSWRCL